jgi:hypothetical protein
VKAAVTVQPQNKFVCFIESFEVLIMVTIKIMVSCDVTMYSLEYVSDDSASICFYGLKLEAAGSCKTLVAIYQTTWSHIPEVHNLHFFIVSVTCVRFIYFLFYVCVIL